MYSYLILLIFCAALPAFAQAPSTAAQEESTSTEITATKQKDVEHWTDKVKFRFQHRLRFETRDNADLISDLDDRSTFLGQRLRLEVEVKPIDHVRLFFQPQHVGAWGQFDGATTGGGAITPSQTSGGTTDRAITLHQGYIETDYLAPFLFRIGRQELTYGDGVILGNADFSNVGRSFDTALIHYTWREHFVDAFFSQLAEDDANRAVLDGQSYIGGVYSSFQFFKKALTADVYALWFNDERIEGQTEFSFITFGHRHSTKTKYADFRFEGGLQKGTSLEEKMQAHMYDAELTFKSSWPIETRLSGEYLVATGDTPFEGKFTRWHPLFQNPHPYLGYLDLIGRQNIRALKGQIAFHPSRLWNFAFAYHHFKRDKIEDSLYSINPESLFLNQLDPIFLITSSKHVGDELDFNFNVVISKHLELQAQGGIFFPGTYTKEAIGDGSTFYAHLQSNLTF